MEEKPSKITPQIPPLPLQSQKNDHILSQNTQTLSLRSSHQCNNEEKGSALEAFEEDINGSERLKRHRIEVGGNVWIPEIWGQEELLKDWVDCAAFDACLVPTGIMSARAALVEEGRRANSGGFRIENRC